ncbi:pseudaminic acid synthase [Shewanella sp. 125m-7]
MNKNICIKGRRIGFDHPPYIIAELSANHNGNIQTAFDIIAAAKKAGADAVKMQTYRPDTITIDCDHADFQIEGGLWHGQSLYQLYEWAHTPWDWHKPLFDYARQLDITLFSSPFDSTAVDLLEDLNAPAYKIASFEAIDLPLIKYAAATGKPLIISTGMANAEEIAEAIDAARSAGCKELAILHCVSAYPAAAEDYNLATLVDMKNRFKLVTGLSDHTLSNITAIAATSLGASIIEKHVTLDRSGGGPDDSFSLEPNELEQLCRDSKLAWSALGKVNYTRSAAEQANLKFRRSLYVVEPVKAGERVTNDNVRSIRPGFGLAPKHLEAVIGTCFGQDLTAGTALKMDHLLS